MRSKGLHYEKLALAYLQKAGLKLIQKNFSSRAGEIDLIMVEKGTIVFVEVRYRQRCQYGSALESVDQRKQKKIILCAKQFLSQHQHWDKPCRFDIVAISEAGADHKDNNIQWLQSAFYENN